MINKKGAIYFDGLCMACSLEINHYKKQMGAENFDFIDITLPSFNPKENGIDPSLVHKVMHVKDPEGRLHQGVDAFRAIWKELPKYQFLYRLSSKKAVRYLLELGYKGFVIIRPYLPRKKPLCESPYCEVKHD